MGKEKTLTHHEIEQIINNYLQALRELHGDNRADQTEVTYRKGWFHIRHPWFKADTPGVPYRPQDLNQVRNASDVAAMAGISDYGAVGTAINLLCRYKNGDLLSKKMIITNAMRSTLIQENRSINESVPAGRAVQKIISKSLGIFCHYVFACIDREDADRFFEDLSTGALLSGDDPVFLLRERLTRERLARTHFPHHEIIALVFKAWNLFREGKKVKTLRWSPKAGESFPMPA